MANKYIKKSSTSLAIKEMQIKTTLRFHLTPVRMAIFKSKNNNKCWEGHGITRTLSTILLVEKQISTIIMGSSMEILQKTKNRTAI
jgi:hypothetical protein